MYKTKLIHVYTTCKCEHCNIIVKNNVHNYVANKPL